MIEYMSKQLMSTQCMSTTVYVKAVWGGYD